MIIYSIAKNHTEIDKTMPSQGEESQQVVRPMSRMEEFENQNKIYVPDKCIAQQEGRTKVRRMYETCNN